MEFFVVRFWDFLLFSIENQINKMSQHLTDRKVLLHGQIEIDILIFVVFMLYNDFLKLIINVRFSNRGLRNVQNLKQS